MKNDFAEWKDSGRTETDYSGCFASTLPLLVNSTQNSRLAVCWTLQNSPLPKSRAHRIQESQVHQKAQFKVAAETWILLSTYSSRFHTQNSVDTESNLHFQLSTLIDHIWWKFKESQRTVPCERRKSFSFAFQNVERSLPCDWFYTFYLESIEQPVLPIHHARPACLRGEITKKREPLSHSL